MFNIRLKPERYFGGNFGAYRLPRPLQNAFWTVARDYFCLLILWLGDGVGVLDELVVNELSNVGILVLGVLLLWLVAVHFHQTLKIV